METTSILKKDILLIKEALEILIEDIENDIGIYPVRQDLLIKFIELYERI